MHDSDPRRDGPSAGDFGVIADEVTCQQFVELITDYFEGTLTPRTLTQVEEHLVLCDWCVTYADQMQETVTALRALREPAAVEPPPAVLAALRAKRGAEP